MKSLVNSENYYLISELKIIQVIGDDAKNFLQNLCTADLNNVTSNLGSLAGFCSPKGRLLASFWITNPSDKTYLLWLSSDIAEEFFKKLSMYKLRSKVSLELMNDSWRILGIADYKEFSQALIGKFTCKLPDVDYSGKKYQRMLVVPDDQSQVNLNSDNEFWNLLEVVSAIPRITQHTKDLFVPQMVNFESVYGVDFKKGCYPGQEIVARSQYLGTIKRRLMIGFAPLKSDDRNSIRPGTPIFLADNTEQEIGRLVLSAYSSERGGFIFQFEIMLSYLDSQLVIKNQDKEYVLIGDIQSPPYPLLQI